MHSRTTSATWRRSTRALSLIVLGLVLALTGCRKDNRVDEIPADEIYEKAKESMDAGNWDRSIAMYKALQTRYPFGRYTEQSMLDIAYSYYRRGDVENALSTLDRFIRTYPAHPNIDYAFYLKGLVNYEQNLGFLERMMPTRVRDRDQSSAQDSFNDFNELLRRFPDSRYVPDARQRMVFLRNNLADYEIVVAEYYLRRVANLVLINEYKRRQAPPGVRITHRAFGRDRRYPITSLWRNQPADVR